MGSTVRTALDTRVLDALPAGRSLDGMVFAVALDQPGADGLVLPGSQIDDERSLYGLPAEG